MKTYTLLEALKEIERLFPDVKTNEITLFCYDGDSRCKFLLQGWNCNATYVNLDDQTVIYK